MHSDSGCDERSVAEIRALISDPNLRFPERPALLRDICVFAMPDQLGIQVRGSGEPVFFFGYEAERLIRHLQNSMDGTKSFDDLIESCPLDFSCSSLAKAIYLLHDNGLLRDAASNASICDPGEYCSQVLYWERYINLTGYNKSAEEVQERIRKHRILVIGEGTFGSAVLKLLIEAGVNDIRCIAVTGHDSFAQDAAERLISATLFKKDLLEVSKVISDSAEEVNLCVIATRNSSADYLRVLNRTLVSSRVPFFVGNETSEGFDLGPFVIPFKSGCYECMWKRAVSANKTAVEEELYQRYLQSSNNQTFLQGEHRVAAHTAAGLLINDVMKMSSKVGTSSLIDSVIRFDPMRGLPTLNRFARVPHCPVCRKVDRLQSPS